MKARKSYPLDQSPLYKLRSRRRLASQILEADLSLLERLARDPDANYRVFLIPQETKSRQVEAPKPILERLHRRLFELLARIEKPPYLQSGVKGRSYITNASAHAGHWPLVKLDLKKFYPSVTTGRVYRFFNAVLCCSPDVAGLLTNLCTYSGHVPTGSCVSQLLAYFASKPMFDDLSGLAMARGLNFTCYVDDMAFSGPRATPALLWEVKRIVHSHGFGYHKSRYYSGDECKVVTGVMIHGERIAVLPSRELEIWKATHALGDAEPSGRLAAIDKLIGSVVAAGQIEARFLERLRYLRREKSKAIASALPPHTSA